MHSRAADRGPEVLDMEKVVQTGKTGLVVVLCVWRRAEASRAFWGECKSQV